MPLLCLPNSAARGGGLFGLSAPANTITATGGTITSTGTYKYHVFTGNGTFTISAFTGTPTIEILAIGGGGGGGRSGTNNSGGGGGGAGGVYFGSQNITATGSIAITIGTGGAGSTANNSAGGNGTSTTLGTGILPATITAGGGGGGGSSGSLPGVAAPTGVTARGSGGGGGFGGSGGTGGAGTFTGGNGDQGDGGGGGGGSNENGVTATALSLTGGRGGNGVSAYSQWGADTGTGQGITTLTTTYFYAGGGGGGGATTTAFGGFGGGGTGQTGAGTAGIAGQANTGSGGGGNEGSGSAGGTGGSGIVIIRYLDSSVPSASFVSSVAGSTLNAGVTTVTFSGHQVGDLLIAVGGSQATTPPVYSAGWSYACDYTSTGDTRSAIIVYKFANSTANETITFTGTGTSTAVYSAGATFRNVARIGNVAISEAGGTASTTVAIPAISPLSDTGGSSAVFAAGYVGGTANGFTSATNGMTASNGILYIQGVSSFAGATGTAAGTVANIAGAVELVSGTPPTSTAAAVFGGNATPYVNAYTWTNASGFGTKYSSPTTPPNGETAAFSNRAGTVAAFVYSITGPYFDAYQWSNTTGFGTRFANPASPLPVGNPANTLYSAVFSTNDATITLTGASGAELIKSYIWSNSSGFGTAQAQPANPPADAAGNNPNSLAINTASTYIALTQNQSGDTIDQAPIVYNYSTSTGYGSRVTNPGTTPNLAQTVAFSPDDRYIAFTGGATPWIHVYAWTNGVGFGTKFANPATASTNYTTNLSWDRSSSIIAMSAGGAARTYPITANGFGTPYAASASYVGATGGTSFSEDGLVFFQGGSGSPYVHAFAWTDASGFGTKYAAPATAVTGTTTFDMALYT